MQNSERRRLAREEQSKTARRRSPLGPIVGIVSIVLIIVAGVVISRLGPGTTPVPTAPPTTPTARPPTSTPVPDPLAEPTVSTAAFTMTDRCITTTLDPPPGPAHIQGGGLDITLRVGSISLLSFVGNIPGDVVCSNPPASPETVDAMVRGIGEIPGVIVQEYSYSGR